MSKLLAETGQRSLKMPLDWPYARHKTIFVMLWGLLKRLNIFGLPISDFFQGVPLNTSGGVLKSANFADQQSYRSADKGGGGPKSRKFCGRPLFQPDFNILALLTPCNFKGYF